MILTITPVHESIDSTLRCLKCLKTSLEKAGEDYHMIVVEDFCCQETVDILYSVPDVHIFHTKDFTQEATNPNLGLAVNIGLDQVKESDDYALIVESDVYLQEDCVVELKQALHDPVAGAAYPLFLHETDNNAIAFCFPGSFGQRPPSMSELAMADELTKSIYLRPQFVPWCHMGTLLIKGDIARNPQVRIDPFYRLWTCDFFLAWAIEDFAGKKIKYTPTARVIHHPHQSSKRSIVDWTQPPYNLLPEGEYNRLIRERFRRQHL